MFTNYADLSTSPSYSVQSPRRPGKGAHGPLTPPSNQLLLLPPGASCPRSLAVWGGAEHRACLPAGLHLTLTRTPCSGGVWPPQPAPCNQLGEHPHCRGAVQECRGLGCLEPGPAHHPAAFSPLSSRGRNAGCQGLQTRAPQAGGDKTAGGRDG